VLARTPVFMAVTVLSLALSIGANTAIFSFLIALLLKALPVPEPQRLVIVSRHIDQNGFDTQSFNYPMFRALAAQMRSFSGALAYFAVSANLTLIAIGIGIGVPLAMAGTRVLASLLFGFPPDDPPTFFAGTALLALAGTIASLIPAARAAG
jgi:putative ABC transport system permease protein